MIMPKIYRDVRAKNRKEVRNSYKILEDKCVMRNAINYANVESMMSSFYAGIDPRRRQEMADGGMVKEDRKALANLSPIGYQRQYARAGYYSNPYIDDSVEE